MSFFEGLPLIPEPEPSEPPRPVWMKPEATLPGVVAQEIVVARNDNAAIAVTGLTAYPTGFEFTLSVVLRQEDRRGRAFDRSFHRYYPDAEVEPEFLRLGVLFADGGAATNLGMHPYGDNEPTGPLLVPGGGGGGGRRYDMRHWVWPLPPPGPLVFVCEWPAYGIAESRAEIDADLIRDAATRAVRLWPDDEA
jgi:hypothetical protein